MDELQKEYTLLFNGITDTICELERTIVKLKMLQLKAEEVCLAQDLTAPSAAVSETVIDTVSVQLSGGEAPLEPRPFTGK